MSSEGWNRIVKGYKDSKMYHLYEWGTLLNKVHGHKLFYLKEDNSIFPLAYVKSLIFGNRLISLPFADYGGLYAKDVQIADKLILESENIAKELDVDFIEVRSPSAEYFEIFEKHGFVRRDDYCTFIFDISKSVDELWDNLRKTGRKAVKKAQKSGVEIVEAFKKEELKDFYQLYLKSVKVLGSPPQPYKFFEEMWDLFHEKNLLKILFARYKGKNIAAVIFFTFEDTIQYVYNPSLERYLELRPNDLLLWHIIEWASKNNFRYFNFGRTREDSGVYNFKERFFKKRFANKVPMPYFYKFYKKKLEQRGEVKYQTLSHLWSKYLPKFIADGIGPWLIKQIG